MKRLAFYAAVLGALLFPPHGQATELQRPYICKEWVAVMTKAAWGMPETETDKNDYNNCALLLAWVNGWSEGYQHTSKRSRPTWLLNRLLNIYCQTHPGEMLSAAIILTSSK